MDETWTKKLGVDRIFGKGTTPNDVASYLVDELCPLPNPGRSKGAS